MVSAHLDGLIGRGRQLLDTLTSASPTGSAPTATRAWQQECAAAVGQLSGGSKSHWLARAYSEAFMVRAAQDRFVEEAAPADIVARILLVLERAAMSLSQMEETVAPRPSGASPHTPRFDFVHNPALRPVLAQAYADSRRALEVGDFGRSLILSCSLLEAIITDALAHLGQPGQVETLSKWSFDTRIAAAEQAGLLCGCARLPTVARRYRDLTDADGELRSEVTVSEREARLTGQVLHVVIRDLNPGR